MEPHGHMYVGKGCVAQSLLLKHFDTNMNPFLQSHMWDGVCLLTFWVPSHVIHINIGESPLPLFIFFPFYNENLMFKDHTSSAIIEHVSDYRNIKPLPY